MYTSEDYAQNRRQLRRRWLGVALPAAGLLALTLAAFFARLPEAVTVLLSILTCGALIFGHSLFIAPVSAYGKHLHHALHGRTRETRGVFQAMEPQAVLREGLYFYPLTLDVGGTAKVDGTRLFYMDANLPRPDWQSGETLTLSSYDNRITAWRRDGQAGPVAPER